jgi:hypothetical protein
MGIIIKITALVFSFVVLLLVSSALGFLGKPTEMGLAIIAGALGLAFSNIDKLSKFKGAGFEAEMRMVETIIENQTEPSSEQKEEAKRAVAITDAENRILKSLQRPGYTWRYAKTVAGELSSPLQEIEPMLASLMHRGLAKKAAGSNGEIWAATAVGKSVQEQHDLKAG